MKRLLLILLLLTGIAAGNAQNANRSGVFVELAGGIPIGNVIKGDHFYDRNSQQNIYCDTYFKGGFDLNLSVGYRWALSYSWAIGAQAGIESNLSEFRDLLAAPKIMLSGRWTSKDLSNGMSFYVQPEAGWVYYPNATGHIVPIGLDLGLNLTNHLYCGLDLSYYYSIDGDIHKKIYRDGSNEHSDIFMEQKSHMSAKIKLGYRF